MNTVRWILLFSFLVVLHPSRGVSEEATLSAEELARVLGVKWTTITIPGTEDDLYSAGAVVEFGDGSKSQESGMIGPITGGSVVKFFTRSKGSKLQWTILFDGGSGSSEFENPFEEYSTVMINSSSSAPPYSEIDYLVKGSRASDASITSNAALKENEAGIRIRIKLRDKK